MPLSKDEVFALTVDTHLRLLCDAVEDDTVARVVDDIHRLIRIEEFCTREMIRYNQDKADDVLSGGGNYIEDLIGASLVNCKLRSAVLFPARLQCDRRQPNLNWIFRNLTRKSKFSRSAELTRTQAQVLLNWCGTLETIINTATNGLETHGSSLSARQKRR